MEKKLKFYDLVGFLKILQMFGEKGEYLIKLLFKENDIGS